MAVQQCKLLLTCLFTLSCFAQDAQSYLSRAAFTYKQLKSYQVETETERSSADRRNQFKVLVTLYSSRPNKVRIEVKDLGNILQSLMVSDGKTVTEYRSWTNQYTTFVGAAGINADFDPDRGTGIGEMVYSTIADGVSKASIRARQTLLIGTDLMPCVIIDVDYKVADGLSRFTFWIEENKGLVLRRAVSFRHGDEIRTQVSSVRALTLNEVIPDAVFEFDPPPGAKHVPVALKGPV